VKLQLYKLRINEAISQMFKINITVTNKEILNHCIGYREFNSLCESVLKLYVEFYKLFRAIVIYNSIKNDPI